MEYEYSLITDFPAGVVDVDELMIQIGNSGIASAIAFVSTEDDGATQRNVTIGFVDPLSAGDEALLTATVNAHDPALELAKRAKVAAIDARTRELIGAGFEYPPGSGVLFSLSAPSQASLLGAYAAKSEAGFTYPVKWNSKADKSVAVLADAVDVANFFLTALGTVRAHLDSGTVLKDAVRAAITVAEVDAIVDTR